MKIELVKQDNETLDLFGWHSILLECELDKSGLENVCHDGISTILNVGRGTEFFYIYANGVPVGRFILANGIKEINRLPHKVLNGIVVYKNYRRRGVFKNTINELLSYIETNYPKHQLQLTTGKRELVGFMNKHPKFKFESYREKPFGTPIVRVYRSKANAFVWMEDDF